MWCVNQNRGFKHQPGGFRRRPHAIQFQILRGKDIKPNSANHSYLLPPFVQFVEKASRPPCPLYKVAFLYFKRIRTHNGQAFIYNFTWFYLLDRRLCPDREDLRQGDLRERRYACSTGRRSRSSRPGRRPLPTTTAAYEFTIFRRGGTRSWSTRKDLPMP